MTCEKLKVEVAGREGVLCTYELSDLDEKRPRTAAIICPGGGYSHLGKREEEPIALMLCNMGINVCILEYALPKLDPKTLSSVDDWTFLDAVKMAAESVKVIKQKWAPKKLIMAGFSAGAQVATGLGAYWDDKEVFSTPDKSLRPDAFVLGYPVISSNPAFCHEGSVERGSAMKSSKKALSRFSIDEHIKEDFPPTFLWHTADDEAVNVGNSLALVMALCRAKVSVEYHLFSHGRHGLSLANEVTAKIESGKVDESYLVPQVATWPSLLHGWLLGKGLL